MALLCRRDWHKCRSRTSKSDHGHVQWTGSPGTDSTRRDTISFCLSFSPSLTDFLVRSRSLSLFFFCFCFGCGITTHHHNYTQSRSVVRVVVISVICSMMVGFMSGRPPRKLGSGIVLMVPRWFFGPQQHQSPQEEEPARPTPTRTRTTTAAVVIVILRVMTCTVINRHPIKWLSTNRPCSVTNQSMLDKRVPRVESDRTKRDRGWTSLFPNLNPIYRSLLSTMERRRKKRHTRIEDLNFFFIYESSFCHCACSKSCMCTNPDMLFRFQRHLVFVLCINNDIGTFWLLAWIFILIAIAVWYWIVKLVL